MSQIKQLSEVPFKLLTPELRTKILLPNFGKIEILRENTEPGFVVTMIFVKRYVPSIKYYNEHLQFVYKTLKEEPQLEISLYDLQLKKLDFIEAASFTKETEMLKRIFEIHDAVAGGEKAQYIDLTELQNESVESEQESSQV